MSEELATQMPVDGKKRKLKDTSETKSSKKRKHDVPALPTPTSVPPKATRKNELHSRAVTRQDSNTADSAFHIQTTSFFLPLSPISQLHPLQGLCAEHLSPLLLTYYGPLGGVVLSYQNARLSHTPHNQSNHCRNGVSSDDDTIFAETIDEYAVSYVWVTADFTLLRASRGTKLSGFLHIQNESNIGLICWNLFNATIDRRHLPRDWRWVGPRRRRKSADLENGAAEADQDDDGGFVDGNGEKVVGSVDFWVLDFESLPNLGRTKGFVSIEGSLIPPDEEAAERAAQAAMMRGALKPKRMANARNWTPDDLAVHDEADESDY